jgi:hypothetical protein
MRCNYVAAGAFAAALLATSYAARAQEPEQAPAMQEASETAEQSARTDAAAANPAAADPFLAKLRDGDNAYLARDFDAAAAAYREAIKERPRDAMGHYRLGEVLRAQSKYEEASEALANGMRFAADMLIQARINFILADTSERANQLPKAKREWENYLKLSQEHAKQLAAKTPGLSADDPVHAASATERLNQVNAAMKRTEEYAAVKERIRQREAELDAKTRGKKEKKEEEKKAEPTTDL